MTTGRAFSIAAPSVTSPTARFSRLHAPCVCGIPRIKLHNPNRGCNHCAFFSCEKCHVKFPGYGRYRQTPSPICNRTSFFQAFRFAFCGSSSDSERFWRNQCRSPAQARATFPTDQSGIARIATSKPQPYSIVVSWHQTGSVSAQN